jgi:hypothetical protein
MQRQLRAATWGNFFGKVIKQVTKYQHFFASEMVIVEVSYPLLFLFLWCITNGRLTVGLELLRHPSRKELLRTHQYHVPPLQHASPGRYFVWRTRCLLELLTWSLDQVDILLLSFCRVRYKPRVISTYGRASTARESLESQLTNNLFFHLSLENHWSHKSVPQHRNECMLQLWRVWWSGSHTRSL